MKEACPQSYKVIKVGHAIPCAAVVCSWEKLFSAKRLLQVLLTSEVSVLELGRVSKGHFHVRLRKIHVHADLLFELRDSILVSRFRPHIVHYALSFLQMPKFSFLRSCRY